MQTHLPGIERMTRVMEEPRALVGYGELRNYESRFYWDPCRYCIDAFFLYLKVCAEVLHKGEKVREGDLQVAVEVKGRVESDFACFFAKS